MMRARDNPVTCPHYRPPPAAHATDLQQLEGVVVVRFPELHPELATHDDLIKGADFSHLAV